MAITRNPRGVGMVPSMGTQPLANRPGQIPTTAAEPAGLPPAAYVNANPMAKFKRADAVAKKGVAPPRRVTPALPDPAQQATKLQQTQVAKQLSPEAVTGMDNQRWQQLLSKFGVFS